MNIAIIIAFRDFRDEEYFIPKKFFENAGFTTTTFSSSTGTAIGINGGEAEIDKLLDAFVAGNFVAAIFVGGRGAKSLMDNPEAHAIVRETLNADKVLGAICIAPVILAKAGVLFKKKATVWSGPMDKSAIKILREQGATYVDGPVVADGKIVTADGPAAAKNFALKILDLLK